MEETSRILHMNTELSDKERNESESLLDEKHIEVLQRITDDEVCPEEFTIKRPISIGGAAVTTGKLTSNMDAASATTRRKLSDCRQVNLPAISLSERPAVSFADPPSLSQRKTPPLSISPLGHTLHHIPQSADYRKKKQVVPMRVYISQFVRIDTTEEDDGNYAGIQFNIPGGRSVTAEYIVELMGAEYGIDRAISKEAFSLWMISELLEVQLKPHHKPYELRRNWAELLEKFATSELESRKKDDEPVLYFRRNVQLSETREQQIVTFCSNALDMLLTDARSSLFLDRCPMFPENAAELAGLGFAMEDGAYDCKTHNVDWLRVHIDDQLPVRIADVIRGPMLLGKALSGFNSPEEIKKGYQHLLFLSFPDDDYVKSRNDFLSGKSENLAAMKMNILHIFSSQTVLLNAMLNSVKSSLGGEEQGFNGDQSSTSSGYPAHGRVTVARTPSLSKCHRMCLASFEDGRFVKAKGSYKKVDWETVQRGIEVVL
ncbi:hypothetical protein Angca_003245 [Angiostrongylus cantonensis]|nr:hypothetical protein Angca_003245 [Angiostrongylus cantonensis]